MKTLLLVAGDPSGDLHAAGLARELKRLDPGLRVAAVGGRLLREEADEFLHDLASEGIVGFVEPLKRLPALVRLLRELKEFMRGRRPLVVCVDYYGFNRWVLEAARAERLRTCYYISPQVWASRPGRVRSLKRLVDRMLVIFPFEEEFYRKAGMAAEFVGHPLLDLLPPPAPRDVSSGRLRLGLLPGSRSGEVRRHLPVMLAAAERIRRDYPALDALVFRAPHLPETLYGAAAARGAVLVQDPGYGLRRGLDLALASSGTATLENALLGVPMVVIYRLSWPTYALARSLVRVPFVSMANLLAKKELAPELLQRRATAPALAGAALALLANPRRLDALRRELAALRERLGGAGAGARAAGIVLEELRRSGTALEARP